jgi:hypothetical protein
MIRDLQTILSDPDYEWNDRLMRLQGWRGLDARRAASSGGSDRVAPAFCAVGSLAAAVLASPVLAAVLAATAVIGVFAANHPVEMVANRLAGRRGVSALPANRAAKRLACALGVVFLGGAAVAFAVGNVLVGTVLAGAMGVTATFVAVTGICVPSAIFTMLWGTDRAQSPSLAAAARSIGPAPTVAA